METKSKVGVIHGRFQAFHKGHLEYVLEGKKRCEFLYIGITNPDPILTTKFTEANAIRSNPLENPFTYYERMEMVRDALLENGIAREEFEIVPLPITNPETFKYYVPLDAKFFVTIYDKWGEFKLNMFKNLNLDVDVMWRRSLDERFTTGHIVRELISINGNWELFVPKSVADYIKKNQLDLRIKEMKKAIS